MHAQEDKELRSLLVAAVEELQTEATEYSASLDRLQELQKSIDRNEITDELLRATRDALPAKAKPMRAGTPAGKGLKETKKLWEELNRLVKSR